MMIISWPQLELSEEVKDTVKNSVKRDSPDDKLKDLLDWVYAIRGDVKHLVRVGGVINIM